MHLREINWQIQESGNRGQNAANLICILTKKSYEDKQKSLSKFKFCASFFPCILYCMIDFIAFALVSAIPYNRVFATAI